MGWYDQQSESSTHFQCIEHRKSVKGPFFHEFLLLKLTDGAVCRVERVGEGSGSDAIRDIGCTARDLIQWFTKSDYDQFSAAGFQSTLVAEVDLCKEFDILDVLAICYSIQNTMGCHVYTLQRYNCYFLCLTVLTVLTRRVASWETMLSNDDWDSSISSLLDTLSNALLGDSQKHTLLRLCALLEPDNPQAGRFILDRLRVCLTSQAGALTSYNRAMSSTLWQTARETALRQALTTIVKPAVSAILQDESSCGTQFRRALHISRSDSQLAIQSDRVLAKHYSKAARKQGDLLVDRAVEMYKKFSFIRTYRDTLLGEQMSIQSSTPLPSLKDVAARDTTIAGNSNQDAFRVMYMSQKTWAGGMKLYFYELIIPWIPVWLYVNGEACRFAQEDLLGTSLNMLLDRLSGKGVLGPLQTSLVMANQLSKEDFTALLVSLVMSDLSPTLRHLQEPQQANIHLLSPSQDAKEPLKTITTIADFQQIHIKARTFTHAVSLPPLPDMLPIKVFDEIINMITEVWKLLPPGFGGAVMPTQ
ncbi:hypothetical protein FRC10_003488 [Ceratobasidium sp. 414]|nr:hypothetical protein FRC10_003488 [Ceratobasidium sp. 414]